MRPLLLTSLLISLLACTGVNPVALCEDQVVVADEVCTGCASVDAGSYDPDGSAVTVVQSPDCDYPLGDNAVVLTVRDSSGATDSCTATVTVVDETPPVVSTTALELWPPNHEVHELVLSDCATVTDNCDDLDVDEDGVISSAYSDEPDDVGGGGDGHTTDDLVIVDDSAMDVRAERQGASNGRVYGIAFTVADSSGNATDAVCDVGVPHDGDGEPAVDDGPDAGFTVE